jgi:hypothetical protein
LNSADEAETAYADIKYKKGIDSQAHPVLDDTTSPQDAHAGGEGPDYEKEVDGDPSNPD